jgi:D-alanine-D-alanine ligase
MFLDAAGDLVVLEVNTLPGMTATSLIPQSALKAGFNLPDLFDKLARHGIERETMRKAVEAP